MGAAAPGRCRGLRERACFARLLGALHSPRPTPYAWESTFPPWDLLSPQSPTHSNPPRLCGLFALGSGSCAAPRARRSRFPGAALPERLLGSRPPSCRPLGGADGSPRAFRRGERRRAARWARGGRGAGAGRGARSGRAMVRGRPGREPRDAVRGKVFPTKFPSQPRACPHPTCPPRLHEFPGSLGPGLEGSDPFIPRQAWPLKNTGNKSEVRKAAVKCLPVTPSQPGMLRS